MHVALQPTIIFIASQSTDYFSQLINKSYGL